MLQKERKRGKMSEEVSMETEVSKETEGNTQEKKKGISEEKLELIIAVLLGITAILTAWASWISSLHGGNQSTNYSESNNLSATGNAMYNQAAQDYMQDMILWNTINDYMTDREVAELNGNYEEAELIKEQLEMLIADNCTEEFEEAVYWAIDEGVTPFDKEGFEDAYFAEAIETLDEADAIMEQGKLDNAHGDAYGLVSVLYSVVLFLLGIVGIFKRTTNRMIVLIVSVVLLVIATIYMATIPLPTNFSFANFFVH